MAGIEVVAVDSQRSLTEFIELPYRLYRDDPHWVPPLRIAVKELLDRRKHPYYANAEVELFLASRNGATVGRIAAIIDKAHNRVHEENAGFFGFFEAVNDPAVAQALLTSARQLGVRSRRGVHPGPRQSVYELRVRHADRRLRFQSDGDDAVQSALLSPVNGPGGPAQGQGSAGLPEQRQYDRPGEDRPRGRPRAR